MSRSFNNNNNNNNNNNSNNNNCNSNIFVTLLSNCMMLKTRAITKICRCAELTDTSNTCAKTFIMIVIMLRYFEVFTNCQGSMRNFPKHHYECKTVSTKFIAREETANIKIFTGKPTKQFCLLLWLKSRGVRGAS